MVRVASTAGNRLASISPVLVAGDLACFLVFALLGMRSHEETLTVRNLVRASGVFWMAWLVVAGFASLYRWPGGAGAGRLLAAWAVAWAIGLAGRWVLFERSPRPGFAAVAFLFLAVTLLAWRNVLVRVAAGPRSSD